LSDEKIDLIIGNVKASLAIEELYVTADEVDIYRKYLRGILTEREVLEMIEIKGRSSSQI